jgi:Reverse transcriptase (RNA-dependent DNA polymerase)
MRLESQCIILALAATRGLDVIQFDIISACLHGTLKEEVYMEQLDGYTAPWKENWAWRLRRGLYGLVQAGRTWNEELNAKVEGEGLQEPAMYVKSS